MSYQIDMLSIRREHRGSPIDRPSKWGEVHPESASKPTYTIAFEEGEQEPARRGRTMPNWRKLQLLLLAFVLWTSVVFGLADLRELWALDSNGISNLSLKIPEWDYGNMWFGGKLALAGKVSTIFDLNAYRDFIVSVSPTPKSTSEWSYPPSVLLLAAPLAIAPLFPSYLLWTFGTAALLYTLLRYAALPQPLAITAIVSSAMFMNVLYGQNGALSAALLCGGLLLLRRSPILAGLLFGVLTFKPHLGLMVPVCLIASRQWRAIGVAALVGAGMVLLTAFCFGWNSWGLFFTQTAPMMRSILEREYPQPYQMNSISCFMLLRSLGVNLTGAWIAQSLAATFAGFIVWRAWRDERADNWSRVVLTIIATFVATPYGYTYDLPSYCVALTMTGYAVLNDEQLSLATKNASLVLIATLWLWPEVQGIAVRGLHFQSSALMTILAFIVAIRHWLRRSGARAPHAALDDGALPPHACAALP